MQDNIKSNSDNITNDKKYLNEFIQTDDLCQHIRDISKEKWENSPFTKGLKDYYKNKKEIIYYLLCFFLRK